MVRRNFEAVDHTLAHLFEVTVPAVATSTFDRPPIVPAQAPDFVREVTAKMMLGRGDDIRVSQLPIDGTFPSGTAAFEKRNISDIVAVWDADLCIQCGQCSFACPHSVIRAKYYDEDALDGAPAELQVGAGQCARHIRTCASRCSSMSRTAPAAASASRSARRIARATRTSRRSTSRPKAPILEQERANIAFFEALPMNDRARVDFANVRGVQFLQPLFEFSGACGGCGETPYLKLLSQLFGDRLQIANATGCSSIYGGNLPVTPWTKDAAGRGPAWSNSLFEDNAEFGLGFRLAADKHLELAATLLRQLAPRWARISRGRSSTRRRSTNPNSAPSAPASTR